MSDTTNTEELPEEQVPEASENATEQAEPSAEERLEALQKENAELKDSFLRKAADFDNYRKRMVKEKQDAFDYANENLLADLLDSIDNMERALQSNADMDSLVQGIEMTQKQLVNMLETKYNLEGFGAKGDVFDPALHEAIASAPSDTAEEVCGEIYLKGYKLKDRVIRHAKVLVNKPATI